MTGLALELRRGIGKWLFLPVAILGIYAAESAQPGGPSALWALAVSALGNSVMLMGPIAAAAAAYAGGMSKRRRMGSWEALSTRGPTAAGMTAMAAIGLWTLASFVVVVAVVFGMVAASATWSGPDLPRTLATGSGLILQVVIGYLIGRVVPRRFTPVAVAVLFYALSVFSYSGVFGYRWQFLLPINLQLYDEYTRLNPAVAPGQLLWYFGIGGLTVSGWALLRGRTSRMPTYLAVGCSVLAFSGAGILVAQDGHGNQPGVVITWTCRGRAPELCLHPALESVRPSFAAQLEPVAARLAGTPFELRRVEQRPRGLGSAPSPGAVAFGLDDDRPGSVRRAVQDVGVGSLGVQRACYRSEEDDLRRGYPYATVVGASVVGDPALAFVDSPDVSAAASWLNTRTDEQLRTWLTQNEEEIRTCRLTAADFA